MLHIDEVIVAVVNRMSETVVEQDGCTLEIHLHRTISKVDTVLLSIIKA